MFESWNKKADEIHDYYIKLEELLQEMMNEESVELRLQLENKKNQVQQLENTNLNLIKEKDSVKELEREKALIENFPKNTQCIYYGKIDNKSDNNEYLIKFGNSNDLPSRIKNHKKSYTNFVLLNAFRVSNKIESVIKKHKILSHKLRKIDVKEDVKFTELIAYNFTDFTLDDINNILLDIVKESDSTVNKELECKRVELVI